MPNMIDEPRIWRDEDNTIPEESYDANGFSNELVQVEEEPALPSISEQKELVQSSQISAENKSILNQLIEINEIANMLKTVNNTEMEEQRSKILDTTCAIFIQQRMQNNMHIEKLKRKVIDRLIDNIDNMDLELANDVLSNITQVTSTDATNAMSSLRGGAVSSSGMPGIQLNINNATADGAQITTQTLNAGPQQVQQLKEVATLNSSIRAWQNIPGKKAPIQAEIVDNSGNK